MLLFALAVLDLLVALDNPGAGQLAVLLLLACTILSIAAFRTGVRQTRRQREAESERELVLEWKRERERALERRVHEASKLLDFGEYQRKSLDGDWETVEHVAVTPIPACRRRSEFSKAAPDKAA